MQVKFLADQTFVEAGEPAKGEKLAASPALPTQAEPQAYSKIIEADAAMSKGDPRKAVQSLTEANNFLDTWIGRFELGRAYQQAGLFVESDAEFEKCIKRRGEALEVLMNSVPSYGYFPPVYFYQGRAREGMNSSGFRDSYRTYLSIRENAGEGPVASRHPPAPRAVKYQTEECAGPAVRRHSVAALSALLPILHSKSGPSPT